MSQFVIEHREFEENDLKEITVRELDQYPIVYILYNDKRKKPVAYIGQTVHAERRMKDHLHNKERKNLSETLLIGHKRFNQSATYNIETNLINHFIADEKFQLQNISQTRKFQLHNYYQKDYYDRILFNQLWEKLREIGIAQDSADVLENKDIYKLSPFKELSQEQLEVKDKILEFCVKNIQTDKQKVFVIEGDAGTGKSVVLSSVFNTIQEMSKDKSSQLHNTNNYLLVNHGEMIKTYRQIADKLPSLAKKNFEKPTTFINTMDKNNETADIVLIDEAHLLLSTRDAYNNFTYDNHLEEIIKRAKIVIVIFDANQVLKLKSHWKDDDVQEIVNEYDAEYFHLKNQYRMQSSPATVNWIEHFVSKEIIPLPKEEKDFELTIMSSPQELKKYIKSKNYEHGLSRIVSTFDYEHKKNGDSYLVDPGGINMPWNSTDSATTWAERPDTINEVGSIYTIQGFDLNYVGVVLGPSVDYDYEKGELILDTSKYQDVGAYSGANRFDDGNIAQNEKERIILNSINVLMKRGIHGLALYAVNDNLRQKLLELQEEREALNGFNG